MGNTESMDDREKRFSHIWADSRADAGKTQEYMANGLGVSKKTIQNWENGATSPDLFMGCEWFRVLGTNPMPYYLSYLFPELFRSIAPEDSDEVIDQALTLLVQNMTMVEKRELLYLMAGRHGSSWYSLLQMFTAHCHTTMQSRVTAARTILDNYEMEELNGKLVCPYNVQPDLTILKAAVEEGKKAVYKKASGYTATPAGRSEKTEEADQA